jgi:hypothetical protein
MLWNAAGPYYLRALSIALLKVLLGRKFLARLQGPLVLVYKSLAVQI